MGERTLAELEMQYEWSLPEETILINEKQPEEVPKKKDRSLMGDNSLLMLEQ